MSAQTLFQNGMAAQRAGDMAGAEALYRQVVAIEPRHPDALHLLSVIARESGRLDESFNLLGLVLSQRPDVPPFLDSLGRTLRAMGRADEAIQAHRAAVSLDPGFAMLQCGLAEALEATGAYEEALAAWRVAAELAPDSLAARLGVGRVALHMADFTAAEAALRPLSGFERNFYLGNALRELGRLDEAEATLRAALVEKPGSAPARFSLGITLLTAGQYREGWQCYASRDAAFGQAIASDWDGTPAPDQTLLVRAEQGDGDLIQFARFLPLAAQRVRVVALVPASLLRLIRGVAGVAAVAADEAALPPHDLTCRVMSLAAIFVDDEAAIPATVPYLRTDPAGVARWRERLADLPGRHIGLVWAGGRREGNPLLARVDDRRSISLGDYGPLTEIPGVTWISLQKGKPAQQSRPAGLRLLDWTSELADWQDTANLIAALDGVVSVDTSVAHLAGALGRPVWLLNRADTDWRWMRGRDDSPWYPTLRQFRQGIPGDWQEPIARVAEAVRDHVAQVPAASRRRFWRR